MESCFPARSLHQPIKAEDKHFFVQHKTLRQAGVTLRNDIDLIVMVYQMVLTRTNVSRIFLN